MIRKIRPWIRKKMTLTTAIRIHRDVFSGTRENNFGKSRINASPSRIRPMIIHVFHRLILPEILNATIRPTASAVYVARVDVCAALAISTFPEYRVTVMMAMNIKIPDGSAI